MIDSLDTVIYSAYFLVPGYVIREIVGKFLPDREHNDFEKVVMYLEYSILEIALWYWLFEEIYCKFGNHMSKYWGILIFAVLITSLITGIAIGLIKKHQVFRRALAFGGINVQHSVPTAWDYKFSTTDTPKWMCICLDDNTILRGRYGMKSLASSDRNNQDIYLEEVFMIDETDAWVREDRTDGIWISSKSIKWINFYKDEEEQENEPK